MKPLFFVTCVPRCGSQWLTRLLDTAPGIKCYHANYLVKKVVGGDIQFMIDAWKGPHLKSAWPAPSETQIQYAIDSWHSAHFPIDTYLRTSRARVASFARREAPEARGWGEVNEFLRYSVRATRDLFDVPIVGLIRNGHQTIPSLLRHHFYNPNKVGGWPSAIEPQIQKAPTWPEATPFERCCWLWADSYWRLLGQGVPIFTLESLNAEFGNVELLCEILRIDISYEDWQKHANKPVDDFYRGRPRPALPPEQLETFNVWAGDIQEHFYG